MGYYGANLGEFGEVIADIELDNEPWQFYCVGVVKRDDGYYISTDGGCSCPTPWESHTLDSFTGPLTADQVREEVTSLAAAAYGNLTEEDINQELSELR